MRKVFPVYEATDIKCFSLWYSCVCFREGSAHLDQLSAPKATRGLSAMAIWQYRRLINRATRWGIEHFPRRVTFLKSASMLAAPHSRELLRCEPCSDSQQLKSTWSMSVVVAVLLFRTLACYYDVTCQRWAHIKLSSIFTVPRNNGRTPPACSELVSTYVHRVLQLSSTRKGDN